MKKILLSSMLFLILSSCVTRPVATKFDADWEFADFGVGQEPRACLKEKKVAELRELLIQCQSNK